MRFRDRLWVVPAFFLLSLHAYAAPYAAQVSVSYFLVAAQGDPDFRTARCCFTATDIVQPMLGPQGLPLLSAAHAPGSGAAYIVHDVNETGEIAWWTPGPTVRATGTATASLPFENRRFFPPNGAGADDRHGFQTAVLRGVIHIPLAEPVSFRIGADDAAFLYVDGVLLADLGGIHPRRNLPQRTRTLAAGDHCFVLFYADLLPVQAQLFFAVDTPDAIVSATSAGASAEPLAAACNVPVA